MVCTRSVQNIISFDFSDPMYDYPTYSKIM
jgi:hypothetical protein